MTELYGLRKITHTFAFPWEHMILRWHVNLSGYCYYGDLDLSLINNGIYWDDGISHLRKMRPRQADRIRKALTKFFKDHKLNLTANINAKVIKFLAATFELSKGVYMLYTKDSYNHHKMIVDNLPKSLQ